MTHNTNHSVEPILFTASVSDRLLAELPRFFGGSAAMFRELFQNAWRAGANLVTITHAGSLITFEDDGRGCADPRLLVTGGDTGWSETAVIEPAGLGFFSLMDAKTVAWIEVRSAGWQMRLVPDKVLSKERLSAALAASIPGMRITLCFKQAPDAADLQKKLQNARSLYPYRVALNGADLPIQLWQPAIEIETPVGLVGLRPHRYKDDRAVWEWRLVEGGSFGAALREVANDNPLWRNFVDYWRVFWIIDEHRCIGCKYCLASCPYNARYINPLMPIVQKCYFCHHRLRAGLEPACVEVCPARARIFGDLNDPDAEVTRMVSKHPFQVLKPEMGTSPQVYYIAADSDAMDPFAGRKKWT